MIDLAINGIVLRTKTEKLGEIGDIEALGKTLTEWTGAAIGEIGRAHV